MKDVLKLLFITIIAAGLSTLALMYMDGKIFVKKEIIHENAYKEATPQVTNLTIDQIMQIRSIEQQERKLLNMYYELNDSIVKIIYEESFPPANVSPTEIVLKYLNNREKYITEYIKRKNIEIDITGIDDINNISTIIKMDTVSPETIKIQ